MHQHSIKKMALFSLNTFVAFGVFSTTIIPFSKPSQAQTSQCNITYLRDTVRSQTNFTNGQHLITLVRGQRVAGNPSFQVYVNRNFAGNIVMPATLIPGQLDIQYRRRPDPYSGQAQVVQKPAAISCSPWRQV